MLALSWPRRRRLWRGCQAEEEGVRFVDAIRVSENWTSATRKDQPMNSRDFVKQTSNRQCGECTVCCTVFPMSEFKKPQWCDCKHLKGNCSIYEQRPFNCKDYACCWFDGHLPDDMRPDKCGIVVGYEQLPHLWIVEARPGAIKEGIHKIRPALSGLVQEYNLGLMLWVGHGAIIPCDFEISPEFPPLKNPPKEPSLVGNERQKVYIGSKNEVFQAVLGMDKDLALKKYPRIPLLPARAKSVPTTSLPIV